MSFQKLVILAVIMNLSLLTPFGAFAQQLSVSPIKDFSKVNPSVQIVSYDATYNNDIYAMQSGSGTIISADGIVLTNHHVVTDEKNEPLDAFEICFSVDSNQKPKCEYTANLISSSEKYDTALLKIEKTDIRGNEISSLPFLDYTYKATLKQGEKIKIVGYPDIGGSTITITEGVISGFEKIGQVNYIKSDTDVSSGNSGGTTLDFEGNFIGIPTSILQGYDSYETLGYSIDLASVRGWISSNIAKKPQPAPKNPILKEKKILLNDSEAAHKILFPFYPNFELAFDSSWEIQQVEKSAISAVSKAKDKELSLIIAIGRFPFEVTEEYTEKVFEELEKNKDEFSSYERKKIDFAGTKADFTTFNLGERKIFDYTIPYGYASVNIVYVLDLDSLDEDSKAMDKVLQTFTFQEEKKLPQGIEQYQHDDPPFEIMQKGDFNIQQEESNAVKYHILSFLDPENIEGEINLYYYDFSESEKELKNEKILQNKIDSNKYLDGFVLINKDTDLVVDGLLGWSLTYTYKGDELNETRKSSEIFLRDGNYYFSIQYDDLDKNFDRNVSTFKDILRSFQYEGNQKNKGKYKIGSLEYQFIDILHHRYIIPIANLADKQIIKGYSDKTFRPESSITRAEALKIILESKLYNQDEDLDKRAEIKEYKKQNFSRLDFADNSQEDWFTPYIRYAKDKKIVKGYEDGSFKPGNPISLAEGLVILFKAHEIKVWQPQATNPDIPWYKPYMDKAYELNILPTDLFDPHHLLTRGEFAAMVDGLMSQSENLFLFF